MSSTADLALATLRAVRAKMTPGPWTWTPYRNNPSSGGTFNAARGVVGDIEADSTAYGGEECACNGRGIVATHNATPALLDALDRIAAVVDCYDSRVDYALDAFNEIRAILDGAREGTP